MEIKILGTGGFENPGLPFNAFLIDGHILVETPPDILQSLNREGVALSDIDAIAITHFHGDHFFGLPFLLFNLFARKKEGEKPPLVIAPEGCASEIRELLGRAISPDHPYVDWSLSGKMIESGEAIKAVLPGDVWFRFFRTEHMVPTYSILAGRKGEDEPVFIATSDTRWSDRMVRLFSEKARLVLCDSNGKGTGGVHLSQEEIVNQILPLLSEGTRLVATHVSEAPIGSEFLEYARPGMVYTV